MDTSIEGIKIIKLPQTDQSPESLSLEINPIVEKGQKLKKIGLHLRDFKMYKAFRDCLTDSRTIKLMKAIDRANPNHILKFLDNSKTFFEKISDYLSLPNKKEGLEKYINRLKTIYARLPMEFKYGNFKYIAPTVLYMLLRIEGYSFQKPQFLERLKLERYTFNRTLKTLIPFYPEYQRRNRIKSIRNKLKHIQKQYGLPNVFLEYCQKIFNQYADKLFTSTEGTITGILAVLALLFLDDQEFTFLEICTSAGASLSGVSNGIKRRFFQGAESAQFKGILKSKELIKRKLAPSLNIKISKKLPKQEARSSWERVEVNHEFNLPQQSQPAKRPLNIILSKKHIPLFKRKPPHAKHKIYSYWASHQDKQDIIRYYLRGLSLKRISEQLKIHLDTVKQIIDQFKNNTISIKSKTNSHQVKEDYSLLSRFHLSKNPFPQHGMVLGITKLSTVCQICGNPLLKLEYKNDKQVFFCKYCFKNTSEAY